MGNEKGFGTKTKLKFQFQNPKEKFSKKVIGFMFRHSNFMINLIINTKHNLGAIAGSLELTRSKIDGTNSKIWKQSQKFECRLCVPRAQPSAPRLPYAPRWNKNTQ